MNTEIDRLASLRKDLEVAISKVNPQEHELLIITPRLTNFKFTTQYCNWLSDTINGMNLKINCIILDDPLSINLAGKPAEGGEEYMRGWNDCLSSLVATKELEDKSHV